MISCNKQEEGGFLSSVNNSQHPQNTLPSSIYQSAASLSRSQLLLQRFAELHFNEFVPKIKKKSPVNFLGRSLERDTVKLDKNDRQRQKFT